MPVLSILVDTCERRESREDKPYTCWQLGMDGCDSKGKLSDPDWPATKLKVADRGSWLFQTPELGQCSRRA